MSNNPQKIRSAGIWFIAIVGAFLIMAWLVSYVRKYTAAPPLNQARIEERRKAFAQLEAENTEMLNNYGWADQTKGLVRLPIERAKNLVVEEWKNPEAARAKLLALADKSAATPAAPSTNNPAKK
jgi:hypothetical protein